MRQSLAGQSVNDVATSLVLPANRPVDVLILGAGRGGMATLEVLQHYKWVNIHAVIDTDPTAPGLAAAKRLGIRTSCDFETITEHFHNGIIIDVTGNSKVPQRLKQILRERPIELISGKSARLLYDLVDVQLRDRRTIRTQGTRLDLLDSMLETTLLLEQRSALSEVAHKSFKGLYNHVRAVKGIAVIFDGDDSASIAGAIGIEKPACDPAASRLIVNLCNSLDEHERFKFLNQPFEISLPHTDACFNIVVPVRQGADIGGALLFDVSGELSHEQEAALQMTSVHLNMTARALYHFQRLETMAALDGLTAMFNRHYLDQKLKEEIHRLKRKEHGTLTCAFIDVDNFKTINDNFGHQVGDQVLRHVARSISECIRDYDICARYGGDEFIILLPAETREEQGNHEQLGLRLLKQISAIRIPDQVDLTITVSIGMATQSSETLCEELLLSMADGALYQAKEAGKCCLRICSDQQYHLGGKIQQAARH